MTQLTVTREEENISFLADLGKAVSHRTVPGTSFNDLYKGEDV